MDRRFDARLKEMLAQAEVSSELIDGLLSRLEIFVQPFTALLSEPEQHRHTVEYLKFPTNRGRSGVARRRILPRNRRDCDSRVSSEGVCDCRRPRCIRRSNLAPPPGRRTIRGGSDLP